MGGAAKAFTNKLLEYGFSLILSLGYYFLFLF